MLAERLLVLAALAGSILLLWLVACDYGQPFASLFVAACGAWGFAAGYVAHGDGR